MYRYRFQKCHFSFAYALRVNPSSIPNRPLHHWQHKKVESTETPTDICADYLWLIFVNVNHLRPFFSLFSRLQILLDLQREHFIEKSKWHTFSLNFRSVVSLSHGAKISQFRSSSSKGTRYHMLDMAVTNKMWRCEMLSPFFSEGNSNTQARGPHLAIWSNMRLCFEAKTLTQTDSFTESWAFMKSMQQHPQHTTSFHHAHSNGRSQSTINEILFAHVYAAMKLNNFHGIDKNGFDA